MGQFVPPTFTDGTGISGAALTAAFADAAAAINEKVNGDIKDGEISNAKLANQYTPLEMQLFINTVPINQAAVLFDQLPIPKNCSLVSLKAICSGVTANASLDIHKAGTGTILSSTIDIDAAGPNVVMDGDGLIASDSFDEDDVVELRCTTDGAGTITNLRVVLVFKLPLMS